METYASETNMQSSNNISFFANLQNELLVLTFLLFHTFLSTILTVGLSFRVTFFFLTGDYLELYTDAAGGIGYGALCGTECFYG